MRHWFISVDIVRLRRALCGATAHAARSALAPAAAAAGVLIAGACVVPCGVRVVVEAKSIERVRVFVRRFTAWFGRPGVHWRRTYRAAILKPNAVSSACAQLRRMGASENEVVMIATSAKARSAGAVRKLTSLLRHVDRSVDHVLGTDEVATRVRRYVGQHDAPPDDRVAFTRLCLVIFAQGIGYDVVTAKAADLHAAFAGFDPKAVGDFDGARMSGLLSAPIVRNAAKIRACVENARRWTALAEKHGTYLGRVASIAAVDDATLGWPSLANALRDDFVHLGESTARQTLKRWGFFTAFAHPGVRRCVQRLGLIDAATDGPALARLVGSAAQRLGRDPYAVEAVLALFAGAGPCKKTPACSDCGLADRCPSAMTSA